MDVTRYFNSLSDELTSLKDRVRYLIRDSHWLTDGEWKESVLRSILRRHLPSSVEVASGFVVAPNASSRQTDVIVYDASKPVLFRDGDLVFLASDAVKAVIEVKSKIRDNGHLSKVLRKLADKSEFLYNHTPGPQFEAQPPFVGLFAYEWGGNDHIAVLASLRKSAIGRNCHNPTTRIVNHVALGPSCFVRYWKSDPRSDRSANYCAWHSYELDRRAFGYFVHNVVDSVSGQAVEMNPTLWFPDGGKERHKIAKQRLSRD